MTYHPPRSGSDKLDAERAGRLADMTFSPLIAKTVRAELRSLAEHTWLFGRKAYLDLAQEVRDAYTDAVAVELAKGNS